MSQIALRFSTFGPRSVILRNGFRTVYNLSKYQARFETTTSHNLFALATLHKASISSTKSSPHSLSWTVTASFLNNNNILAKVHFFYIFPQQK